MLLIDILKKNALDNKNKIAFTMKIGYRVKSFSYLQVYELAKKFALFLKKNEVGKDDKIIIFAPNSPYWGIAFWGSLLNGSVFVPVNVQSNLDLIKKIINQTGAKIIFKSKYFNLGNIEDVLTIEIDFLEDYIEELDAAKFIQENILSTDCVEILYTSGTTGDPKGVILTHENIVSNVLAIADIMPLNFGKERLLSVLPLTHIFEQTIGFFLAQYNCAQIVYTHSYSLIVDLLREYKITKLLAVPEFLKILMIKIEESFPRKIFNIIKAISYKLNNNLISKILFFPVHRRFGFNLDIIASGGAFLDPNLEKDWNSLGFTILQGYGLTETSPVISCNTLKNRRLGSVGKVIKNMEIKINQDGEILVKGPGVFSGYYNNLGKTQAVFTQDGFFKTGDIGYLDERDFLFIKGRKKYVIIGPSAQNIFPEDVEIEINKIDGVKDSCVLGLETESGVVRIHAVLLLEDNIKKPGYIIDKTNNNLASYQKISEFTVWPEQDFPRSATKKIKRDAVLNMLKEMFLGQPKLKYKPEASQLIKILSQVSGLVLDRINNKTTILEQLQVDSLMLVEIIMRIEQEFGVLLDESLILSNTTVQDLQDIIDKYEPSKKRVTLSRWPRLFCVKVIRNIGQFWLILFGRIFFKLKVEGLQNLENMEQVVFMPNHISYIDPFVLLMSLPYKVRRNLSYAAAKDVLYEEYKYVAWLADLFFNSFPLPRANGDGIKIGLDFMGQIIDSGYSVVVFPEGMVSRDASLLTLKRGAGLMAIEMGLPIIPVKIENSNYVVPYGKLFPRQVGSVIVKFGKPIMFKYTDTYTQASEKIESKMKEL